VQLARQDFASAENDFRELEKDRDSLGVANFGFAAVAESRQDTNQALRYLRLCLSNTSTNTLLWQQANAHLKALEPAPAAK
jgi:hypothetical protein